MKAAFSNTRQTPKVDANDAAALEKFRSMGFNLIEIELPKHSNMDFTMVMYGEANAALRDPIESQPAGLVRQDRVLDQNNLRLLFAVGYVDADRYRTILMHEMAEVMSKVG